MKLHFHESPMAVEQLVFRVDPEHRRRWLEIDHRIWTTGLAENEGFAGKEAWISGDRPEEITVVVYWTSLACWQSIDRAWVVRTDEEFRQATADIEWELVRAGHEEEQFFRIAECIL